MRIRRRSWQTSLILCAAGILAAPFARADQLVQVFVYCSEPRRVTAVLSHTMKNQYAGSIIRCAGDCGGRGRDVHDSLTHQIEDVIAGFPRDVYEALAAQAEKHEANAAAGNAQSLMGCGGETLLLPRRNKARCEKKEAPAAIFVNNSPRGVTGKIHSQPEPDSPVSTTPPNGTRLVYREVREKDGETWYYVTPPGRAPGWIRGGETSCVRPVAPEPPKMIKPLDAGLMDQHPTAAQAAGARG